MITRTTPGIALILIVFALYPAASSCTAFDDAVLPAPEAGSSTSGQGGGGGNSGSVTSGTSGATGTGGNSGTSGSGGSGGVLSPLAYLSETDAARVCSKAVTCPGAIAAIAVSLGIPANAANYSQCMTWLAGSVPPSRPGFSEQKSVLQCIAAASNCSDALACLPFLPIDANAAACSDGQSKCIDAQSAANCTTMVSSNCSAPGFAGGSSCNAAGGEAECITAPCNSPGTSSCSGNILTKCTGAGQVEFSCELPGLSCANGAGCKGGGACGTPGKTQCSGDTAQVCTAGELSEFNCADIGANCIAGPDGEARCELPGAACTPNDANINVCVTKKKITVCIDGTVRTINCPVGNCQDPIAGQSSYCG